MYDLQCKFMNQNLCVTPLKVKVTILGEISIVVDNEDAMIICALVHYVLYLCVMCTCALLCYAHLHAL